MKRVWFITGASRGLGVDIARAAIRAGDNVVATARSAAAVNDRLGADSGQLLAHELDVTDAAEARAAVAAAVARFGTIDVLVNNAGYGHLGFFEESGIEDVQAQFATNLFGVFNVTWAVLPIMRAARRGLIYNMSSVAGIRGSEFTSLYSASKFALEGFSESLARELAPFHISLTIVEPGPFRTDFLTDQSLRFGAKAQPDYDSRRTKIRGSFEERSHKQPGDPAKLAETMVHLANEDKPPLRFAAGDFAVKTIDAKLAGMRDELEKWRELSVGTDHGA
jgi:NAD(P)-dependent dehydrogenase (short-subunit alcohol dehydrogenase family)